MTPSQAPQRCSLTVDPWIDWMGVTASIACAIHCAAMPFAAALLPMLRLQFLAHHGFHQLMVVVCLVLAANAFVPGWCRHHQMAPALIGGAGLVLIAVAAFALENHRCLTCRVDAGAFSPGSLTSWLTPLTPWLTPLGGGLLVLAHLANRRCDQRSVCCR